MVEWTYGLFLIRCLSSLDYQRELINMISNKPRTPTSHTTPSSTTRPSIASSLSALRTPRLSDSKAALDPDSDSVVWCEPEAHSAMIERQDHPRDPSGLLSLRDVLRQRRTVDPNGSMFGAASAFSPSKFSPSKFVSAISGAPMPRVVSAGTPPSAWAQPAVEVSMHAADGKVSGLPDTVESAEKALQDLEYNAENAPQSSLFPLWRSAPASPDPSKKRHPPSALSVQNCDLEPLVTSLDTANALLSQPITTTSDRSRTPTDSTSGSQNSSTTSLKTSSQKESKSKVADDISTNQNHHHDSSSTTSMTITASLASTVTNAMRYFMHNEEAARPTSPSHHHKLLALDNQAIEDRPHLKYDWTVGKRLKFSCTVYYAKQFEYLRQRCGVDDIFSKSLARSVIWEAEGGKSKSNFWKTCDDRFVIKTLVNAWNVADL